MSTASAPIDGRFFKLIGVGSALINVAVFTAIGWVALDDVVYGAIVGVYAGAGAYLFLPWFMHLSALQDEAGDDVPFGDLIEQVGGNPPMRVLGLGLEMGGIAMLGVAFALEEPDPLLGIAVAIGVAAVIGLAGSVLVRR